MRMRQQLLFWTVVTVAAIVTISGIIYTFMAIYGPLRTSILGRPFPAWLLGLFTAFWGGRMLYRLYRLPRRHGVS